MLKFIFGRPYTGKTYTVLEKIKTEVMNNREVVLFVPEQFSFETEKSVLRLLGDDKISKVRVLSFTRLFDELSDYTGGICGKLLTDSDKIILMNRVLNSLESELTVWGKYAHSLSFAKTVLDTIGEFKVNAVTPQDIKTSAQKAEKQSLKNKLTDIALIYESFDAVLGEKYIDPVDKLTKVYRDLENVKYFKNKTVFFDSFKAFTGQQFKIIDRIFSQADDVYFAFNNESEVQREFDIFTILRQNIAKIEALAKKNNIKIAPPIVLKDAKYENQKFCSLERLMAGIKLNEDLKDTVTVCKAESVFDEAEFAARTIKRLIREKGYRFKDFLIIARDTEKYQQAVEYVCRKNEINCFFDKRVALNSLPFSMAVNAAISALNLSTENILKLHKCGFGGLSADEVSRLENYAYLWNIDGKMWQSRWDMSPKGFDISELCESDVKELDEINRLREMAIAPIIEFKNNFKSDALQMAKAIVRLFEAAEAKSVLNSLCERFKSLECEITPDVLKQGYDRFMAVLDSLVNCFGNKTLSVSEFQEALNLALSIETVGIIPQFIDEVSFGAADRIQPAHARVVFILGANQGVFPKNIDRSGIWAANERKKLIEMGIEISDNSIFSAIDEEYLVYSNLSCASQRLFISYSTQNTKGEELLPSPFLASICENLNASLVCEPQRLNFDNLPETESSVFSELCRRFGDLSEALTLDEVLPVKQSLKRISDAVNKDINTITPENAKKLFGSNINLSASKIDTLNHCRFSFFCKYGLRAEKLRAAEFNVLQRGNIAHYVLERVITDYKKKITDLSDNELCNLTDKYIEDYLSKVKGFATVRDSKFDFIISRISRSLKEVVCHIAADFRQSEFKPVACEFKIGFNDGLKVEFPFDNGKISINGSIDRIDEYNGFIRIIDYKTGTKTFKLPDIIYGLNLQMLIYLYSVIRGRNIDDKNAAAILYMPAKRDIKDAGLAMNGLIKADIDLSIAMEKENKGEFVPKILINKDGSVGKRATSFIKEDGFSEIFDYIEKVMRKTGNLISSGDIAVSPIDGRESEACKYCDFKTVCFAEDSKITKVPKLSNDQVFNAIKEAKI